MLKRLSIRNYALIDGLDIEFDRGLNIITGETGAGKSIILGALSLILGQRAESKYFFNQEKKCVIEGIFHLPDPSFSGIFESHELDFESETILRREISMDGKSRAFINDTPVNLSILKQIGELLIAIHSQHASMELSAIHFQLSVVDTMAQHSELLQEYRDTYDHWKKNQQEFHLLETRLEEARQKQDYEQYLYDELCQAALQTDEQLLLEQNLERLQHAESIKRGLLQSIDMLSEQETAALPLLKEVSTQLNGTARYEPAVMVFLERIKSVMIELKDVEEELKHLEESTLYDPALIVQTQERLHVLYSLQQKHRVSSVAELVLIQQRLEKNLQELVSSDESLTVLEKETSRLHLLLKDLSVKLHHNRLAAIPEVEGQIAALLQQMGMPAARLKVALSFTEQLNERGGSQLQFLFSANSGHAPGPVQKIASGGELSRLMLAIKSLLARKSALATLIFDEIDTGISGETALNVGKVIEGLSEHMQLISISHLPQIAAKGQSHYYVFKREESDKSTTGIRKLTEEERVLVIAEMLSGKNPGASAIAHARELLS